MKTVPSFSTLKLGCVPEVECFGFRPGLARRARKAASAFRTFALLHVKAVAAVRRPGAATPGCNRRARRRSACGRIEDLEGVGQIAGDGG